MRQTTVHTGGPARRLLPLLLATAALAPIPTAAAAATAGTVVNVPGDVATIQAGIDAAPANGTVVVAPGVYHERLDFHGKAVEVASAAGPEATVVDGDRSGTVVLFQGHETRASVLRGFTVRNGSLGGIYSASGSPSIVGNIITANTGGQGTGLAVIGGSALVKDNVFRANTNDNSGGGGLYLSGSGGTEVVGNTFEDNVTKAFGGAIYLNSSDDVLIQDNVFRDNRAGTGGAIWIGNYSEPLISQNVFAGNVAGEGGAVSVQAILGYQGTILANNTMAANRASAGSAIASSGYYKAVNNVITGDASGPVVECTGQSGQFFYNDVYNGTATPFHWCTDTTGLVGNVSVDPRLAPDLSLTAGSPLIDAGHDDPLLPLLPPADANGAPRVRDGNGDGVPVADLGAYEWPGRGVAPKAAAPAAYHALTPARILDTRSATGVPVAGKLGAGALGLQVAGRGGVPAAGVSAVTLNVTVTEPTAASFLTVWPEGDARPVASNLNYVPGQTVPNLVTVKLGAGGRVDLFNNAGAAHVVSDVAGWYGPGDPVFPQPGGTFHALAPTRILDTRSGTGVPAPGKLGLAGVLVLQVTGQAGVPDTGVSAVVLNVTVTEPTADSFLTAWPYGDGGPDASNLNYGPGQTVPNLVVVRVGSGGKVNLYNFAGSTHVIADVAGWFGTDRTTPAGAYTPVVPARLLDTRSGLGASAAKVGPGGAIELQVGGRGGIPAGAVTAVVLNVTVTEPTGSSFLTAWPAGDARPLASNLNFGPGQTVPNLVVVKVGPGGKIDLFNNAGSTHVVADVAGWYAA